MKRMKKYLSIVLALMMVVCAIPMSTFTASAEITSGICGENVTWSFDEETGTLTISGEGEMEDYDWYSYDCNIPWENHKEEIIYVVVDDGVTSIGFGAFSGCESATSIIIPDSVVFIGSYAFSGCKSLANITIPNGITSIGWNTFSSCISLTDITIPDSVTSIGSDAFCNCTNLTRIQIPDSVTSISNGAFSYCTNLTDITLPESITSIENYAFYNTAYYNDTNNWENDVLYIGKHLIEASDTISGEYEIKENTLVIAASAFEGCTNLTEVVIPDSVTYIDQRAFSYCDNLVGITIPNSVSSIGNQAFYNCTALSEITVNSSNQYYSSDENGILFNKDKTVLIQYPIGNTRTSYTFPDNVTTIGEWSFFNSDNLVSITLPTNVTKIESSAFRHCTSLKSIILSDYLISIEDSAFYWCTELDNIILPNDTVSIGELAFYGCTNLTTITIPDSVTSVGYSAFNRCTSLTRAIIGHSLTSIDNSLFEGCTSLTSVTIPDNVISISDYAFSECIILTNIYYTGTEEQWNNISIGTGNDTLYDAIINFNYSVKNLFTLSIQPPSTTTIRYNDGIVLHANLEGDVPDGCTLVWTASNSNFNISHSENGNSLQIISKSKGYTTFTVSLVDADGYVLAEDSIEMYSQAGFFDKIAGFFRSLFGGTKIYEN